MSFRVATLNLARNEKRWEERRELIVRQFGELKPDIIALNEISIGLETGRWLQKMVGERFGIDYFLVQQSGSDVSPAAKDAEGFLTRYRVVEEAHIEYLSHPGVGLTLRVEIEGQRVDFYVTHLYRSRGEDAIRFSQAQQLLGWLSTRHGVRHRVVCGDFNATLEIPSVKLMASVFKPTQTQPTAFTPLQEPGGTPSHPSWERFDRCIDYIWVTGSIKVLRSGVCFNKPAADDPTLWPSDHVGVWADLEFK